MESTVFALYYNQIFCLQGMPHQNNQRLLNPHPQTFLRPYFGGSLPNVNQMSSPSMELHIRRVSVVYRLFGKFICIKFHVDSLSKISKFEVFFSLISSVREHQIVKKQAHDPYSKSKEVF